MTSLRDPGAGALLLLLLLGCAGATPAPATGGNAAASSTALGDTSQQVMVTFPAAPPSIWAQTAAALAQTYRIRVVVGWTMASIGEYCVVFEVPRGRSVREVVKRLGSDPRVGLAQVLSAFETQSTGNPYARLQHGS